MAKSTSTSTFTFTTAISEAIISLASASRKTRETTQPIHVAYISATTREEQKAIEQGFRCLWIQGDTNVSEENAELILAAGKGENQLDKGAVMRSYRAFQHHVVRDDVTDEVAPAEASDEIEVTDELLALALRMKMLATKTDKKLARKLANKALALAFAK